MSLSRKSPMKRTRIKQDCPECGRLNCGHPPVYRPALKRTRMKASRPEVTIEEKRTRTAVAIRSDGYCEARLVGCLGRATDMAHRIGRGVGGEWSPQNILFLCRACHSWCHNRVEEARDLGLMLRSDKDPLVEPVAYCNSGWVRLDADGGLWPVGDEAA